MPATDGHSLYNPRVPLACGNGQGIVGRRLKNAGSTKAVGPAPPHLASSYSYHLYPAADPVRRQVNPAAVAAGFDPLFDHLFAEDLKFNLVAAIFGLVLRRRIGIGRFTTAVSISDFIPLFRMQSIFIGPIPACIRPGPAHQLLATDKVQRIDLD